MTAGERYTGPWRATNVKMDLLTEHHGLPGQPTIIKVLGRESDDGPVFELDPSSMVVASNMEAIILDREKLSKHCNEVRVVADWHWHDEETFERVVRGDKSKSLETPWLKEVDEL